MSPIEVVRSLAHAEIDFVCWQWLTYDHRDTVACNRDRACGPLRDWYLSIYLIMLLYLFNVPGSVIIVRVQMSI